MMQNFDQMTNAELKRYISEHRNNEEAFSAALQVLMSRRDPNAPSYPSPFSFADPDREVEAIFREEFDLPKIDSTD
ncbi:DUF6887 family protein [Phormidesmis priestleyi]